MKSNSDLIQFAINTLQQQTKIAIIIVTSTWGSSPRKSGSIMLVTENNQFYGSVSGGCIEIAVVHEAQALLADDHAQKISQTTHEIANEMAWEHNLSCGGKLELAIIKLTELDNSWLSQWLEGIQKRIAAELFFDYKNQLINFRAVDAVQLKSPKSELNFKLAIRPQPKIICLGAVHITQYLAEMALQLGYGLTVIEPRETWASANPLPTSVEVISQWPVQALANLALDSQTAFITLTHDIKFDDDALAIALTSDCFYIGALGSSRTHAKRITRLTERGISGSDCQRIHGPIGLDIGAENPAEIALSIWAEVVQMQRRSVANNV
jgi:xanthine dehydrogenase accessory factor